jgi:hypothetical protein
MGKDRTVTANEEPHPIDYRSVIPSAVTGHPNQCNPLYMSILYEAQKCIHRADEQRQKYGAGVWQVPTVVGNAGAPGMANWVKFYGADDIYAVVMAMGTLTLAQVQSCAPPKWLTEEDK